MKLGYQQFYIRKRKTAKKGEARLLFVAMCLIKEALRNTLGFLLLSSNPTHCPEVDESHDFCILLIIKLLLRVLPRSSVPIQCKTLLLFVSFVRHPLCFDSISVVPDLL